MTRVLQITDDQTPVLPSSPHVQVDEIQLSLESLGAERRKNRHARLQEFIAKCADRYDLAVLPCFGRAYRGSGVKRLAKSRYERRWIARLVGAVRQGAAALAVIDNSDDYTIHPVNADLLEACDVYFKRELAIDRWRSLESLNAGNARASALPFRREARFQQLVTKLEPVALGLGPWEPEATKLREEMGTIEKKYDLFYAGDAECRPMRASVAEELSDLAPGFQVHTPDAPLAYPDYVRAIAESWLCLSPPGLGWDCYRHYEALYFGSLPVIARPDILLQVPFVHGVNALVYDPERPLVHAINDWWHDKDRMRDLLDRFAQSGRAGDFLGPARTGYIVARTLHRSPDRS